MLKLVLAVVFLVALMVPLQANLSVYSQGKATSGLHPLDATPLMNRVPLILVHGINPSPKVQYGWAGFLRYVKGNETFHKRYKLYLFVFDARRPIPETGGQLREALKRFLETENPAHPLRIAALSLGGLLVQEALDDKALEARVERILGIGIPFHGTPLANPQWVRTQLADQAFLSPLKLSRGLIFKLARQQFPTFEQDFCWDNFDGLMPTSLVEKSVKCSVRSLNGQEKYVLYAGFFGAQPEESAWLKQTLSLPETIVRSQEKRGLWGRHGLFPYVQASIAGMPLVASSLPAGEGSVEKGSKNTTNTHDYPMMTFNDGISPISSQLWLGRFANGEKPVDPNLLWQAVSAFKGTEKARLFEGLDHRDWLEGGSRLKGEKGLKDFLHCEQPARNIFEWLEYDLMRS